jgi:hypothetical protein
MILTEKTQFSAEPAALEYDILPTGRADVWVRRNIERVDDFIDNGPDAESVPYTYWTADEAYMRTDAQRADLEADLAAAWAAAAEWAEPTPAEPVPLEARVEALEALGLDMLGAIMGV